jgi:hypothetical protein
LSVMDPAGVRIRSRWQRCRHVVRLIQVVQERLVSADAFTPTPVLAVRV